jgi:hypothetical protein
VRRATTTVAWMSSCRGAVPRALVQIPSTCSPQVVGLFRVGDGTRGALGRPTARDGIKALMERGFYKAGNVESRLGYRVGQLGT